MCCLFISASCAFCPASLQSLADQYLQSWAYWQFKGYANTHLLLMVEAEAHLCMCHLIVCGEEGRVWHPSGFSQPNEFSFVLLMVGGRLCGHLQDASNSPNTSNWIHSYGDFTTQSDTEEGLWFSNGTLQTYKVGLLSRTYAMVSPFRPFIAISFSFYLISHEIDK